MCEKRVKPSQADANALYFNNEAHEARGAHTAGGGQSQDRNSLSSLAEFLPL